MNRDEFLESVEDALRDMDAYSCHIHGKENVGVCRAHWEAICTVCGRCDGCLVDDLGDDA